MIKSAKIAAATAALTGFASPAFADGGHMTMSGFEQIVHFLSSPVHGTLTVVALAGLGYLPLKPFEIAHKEIFMLHNLISKFDDKIEGASAHCDIPCGIYDARIVTYYAVSTLRQMDILLGLKDKGLSDTAFAMQAARNTAKKEEMAENTKHQTRIIWGDFMKGDKLKKHPNAHELAHNIMLAASACKQDLHREDGVKLVDACNEFAEVFWDMKGIKTKKVVCPYEPKVEVVEPDL